MSSRFAAAICGHLMRRQSTLGIRGDALEIGTFEGRFFIAMALGLGDDEKAIGIDRFDWPDDGIEARFLANCAAHGLDAARFVSWKADSRAITSPVGWPSAGRPDCFWNRRTAERVLGPSRPSGSSV